MLRTMRHCFILLPVSFGGVQGAWAQLADPLTFSVGYTRQHEDNLFRAPHGSAQSEQIAVTSVGLGISKAYSLQQIDLQLGLVDYRYQSFANLSFAARNYNAAWRWSITPWLHGNLSDQRAETVNSFADSPGSTARNRRTENNRKLDAEYELDSTWRLQAAVSSSELSNELPLASQSNSRSNATEVALRHLWTSGSRLGYSFRRTDGTDTPAGVAAIAEQFARTDQRVDATWAVSGLTSVDASIGRLSRSSGLTPQRDFSGTDASAGWTWAISGKSALALNWTRQLASYPAANIVSTRSERFSIRPSWQFSPKTTLSLRRDVARVVYLDGAGIPQRRDRSGEMVLSLDFRPDARLALSASLQGSRRSSNLAALGYRSQVASVSAQLNF